MPGGVEPRVEEHSGLGLVWAARRFDNPAHNGVAEGFQLAGWWDFPHGGFKCWVEDGVQKVKIQDDAPTNGDAGIERHLKVTPGEVYRLTARVRVVQKKGDFKARVNLSARRSDNTQVAEANEKQVDETEHPVERIAEARIPHGADFLSARVKFHSSDPGDSGEGEIHEMKLERIR